MLEYQRRSGTKLGWSPVTAGMIFERELAVMGEDLPMLKWLLGKAGVDLKALVEAEDLDDPLDDE